MFTLLWSKLNFIDFLFTWEENLTNFRKFSQEMEHSRAKWTHYDDHMANAKGEHNSYIKLFITQTFLWSPSVRVIQVSLYLKVIRAFIDCSPLGSPNWHVSSRCSLRSSKLSLFFCSLHPWLLLFGRWHCISLYECQVTCYHLPASCHTSAWWLDSAAVKQGPSTATTCSNQMVSAINQLISETVHQDWPIIRFA